MKIPNAVGYRGGEGSGAAEKVERVGVANDRNVDPGRSAGDGDGSVKYDAAVVEGIRQSDRVGMDGTDEISAGSEILGMAVAGGEARTEEENEPTGPCD
jgi:hypothetical protein